MNIYYTSLELYLIANMAAISIYLLSLLVVTMPSARVMRGTLIAAVCVVALYAIFRCLYFRWSILVNRHSGDNDNYPLSEILTPQPPSSPPHRHQHHYQHQHHYHYQHELNFISNYNCKRQRLPKSKSYNYTFTTFTRWYVNTI